MKRSYISKRSKNILYAQQTARMIKELSGVNVFENSRKQNVIESRSLLIYILREVENMTYYFIRDFFVENGKDYDHSTAMHSYQSYPMYAKHNKQLEKYFTHIVNHSISENSKKLIAKSIIDSSDADVAEVFTYMINN
jgi:hypothetical protein